jgi:predicted DNA-binding transcriptional regulator AlpA
MRRKAPQCFPIDTSQPAALAVKVSAIGTQSTRGMEAPQQLSLELSDPPSRRPKASGKRALDDRKRIAHLDQRMSTTEVLRVVGVHRVTLFRWMRKGTFPPKHFSGGWLRSDIERWLARKAPQPEPITGHSQHKAGRAVV